MLSSNLVKKAKTIFTQKSCNPTNFMITSNFINLLHKRHFRNTLLCNKYDFELSSSHDVFIYLVYWRGPQQLKTFQSIFQFFRKGLLSNLQYLSKRSYLCNKKSREQILQEQTYRKTDRQTDRQGDLQGVVKVS